MALLRSKISNLKTVLKEERKTVSPKELKKVSFCHTKNRIASDNSVKNNNNRMIISLD